VFAVLRPVSHFPQHRHTSERAFAFLAASISMGTGLPGIGIECVKHEGRMPWENVKVFEFKEIEANVT